MPLSSPSETSDPDDSDLVTPDPADELDNPYVHTVSTEEFVEAVEAASREEE